MFSRGGILLPSVYADARYIDAALVSQASLPAVKANLTAALAESMASAYQTNDTPGYTNCVTDETYSAAHQNFLGPICEKDA